MDKKDLVKYDKRKNITYVPLKNILSGNQHYFPIQKMVNKLVFDLSTKYKINHFQVVLCLRLDIDSITDFNIKLLNQ